MDVWWFPTISHVKIETIIQLKQPFINGWPWGFQGCNKNETHGTFFILTNFADSHLIWTGGGLVALLPCEAWCSDRGEAKRFALCCQGGCLWSHRGCVEGDEGRQRQRQRPKRLESGRDGLSWRWSSKIGEVSLFNLFLEAKDMWGRTPLHWAVVNGHRRRWTWNRWYFFDGCLGCLTLKGSIFALFGCLQVNGCEASGRRRWRDILHADISWK